MLAVLGVPNVVVATVLAVVVAAVFRDRVFGANERTETSWLDAYLKAFFIVVMMVFFLIYLPSYVITSSVVTELNGDVQDLIGAGVWGGAFVVSLGALWLAHKENRI